MHVQDVLPRDAIRGIDDPTFGPEYFGDPDDEVLVVDGDPPRAYPVRILSHHEIVNDRLGGGEGSDGGDAGDDGSDGAGDGNDGSGDDRPVAVTWCPICRSGVVYDRRVEGRTLTFGTSGKLADDALVMYDRESDSEWKQPLGRAIAGPLSGTDLTPVPAGLVTWEAFRESHPDGVVLQPVYGTGPGESVEEAYGMAGYERYEAAEAFGLRAMRGEGPERTWKRADLGAKTPVLGVVNGDAATGYPLPAVEDAGGVVHDSVGDLSVVVVAHDGRLHAFADPGFDLRPDRTGGGLRGDGTTWAPVTGESVDGRRLKRVPARRLYAFAWQDDHGAESFHGL